MISISLNCKLKHKELSSSFHPIQKSSWPFFLCPFPHLSHPVLHRTGWSYFKMDAREEPRKKWLCMFIIWLDLSFFLIAKKNILLKASEWRKGLFQLIAQEYSPLCPSNQGTRYSKQQITLCSQSGNRQRTRHIQGSIQLTNHFLGNGGTQSDTLNNLIKTILQTFPEAHHPSECI